MIMMVLLNFLPLLVARADSSTTGTAIIMSTYHIPSRFFLCASTILKAGAAPSIQYEYNHPSHVTLNPEFLELQ